MRGWGAAGTSSQGTKNQPMVLYTMCWCTERRVLCIPRGPGVKSGAHALQTRGFLILLIVRRYGGAAKRRALTTNTRCTWSSTSRSEFGLDESSNAVELHAKILQQASAPRVVCLAAPGELELLL